MVYIPNSNSIACIDINRKLSYLQLDNLEITRQIEAAYDGQLSSICLNEYRDEVAVGDESGEIKIFSNYNGKLLHLDQMTHACGITSLAYSPDGSRLISGDNNGSVILWKVCDS